MVDQDFDHIANHYDRGFSDTVIGRAQRKLVWNVLDHIFPTFKNINVLEVNCGTGVDAEYFVQKGADILATDISSEMVRVAASRLEKYPNAHSQVLGFGDINSLSGSYDLIFSNFGGLNCLDENALQRFIQDASLKVAKGGRLVLVIMPKNTIWEMLYYSSKLSPKKALRRMSMNGVEANVEGKKVKTYYHNPKFFEQFEVLSIRSVSPIGLYVPPSYLEPRFSKKPKKVEKYYRKDLSRLGNRRMSKFADHYCIVLEKK